MARPLHYDKHGNPDFDWDDWDPIAERKPQPPIVMSPEEAARYGELQLRAWESDGEVQMSALADEEGEEPESE